MELEELKQKWVILSKEVEKQKIINQKTYYTYGSHSGKQAPCQIRD